MKRFIIWFSVILVGCCMMTMPRNIEKREDLVSTLKDSTVALVARHYTEDHSYMPYCSGVWISKSHILTAKHCIPPSDPVLNAMDDSGIPLDLTNIDIEYSTRDDHRRLLPGDVTARPGRTVAVDDYQDLAVIQADADDIPENHPIVVIASADPRDGAEIHIVGHTMGFPWTYLKGYVSATRSPIFDLDGHATKAIQIASPAYKGNSGGGAFNELGELIGISSWISLLSPEMGFWISRDVVIDFLRRNHIE